MTNRAPTGGITSAVNGQFYEGGQFSPEHGLFCGKGKNRVTKAEFDRVSSLVSAAGKTLEYREETGEFVVLYVGGNIMFRARSLATLAKAFPG
jgi:hypothetical protein